MPAPVRSGRRHPPRVTWFWLVSAYCTCPGRGRLASRFARRRSSSRHLPPADPVPAPGASSGSRGDGGHRLADGEPIDRSARHAGRGCGRGFSCWRPPPRYPREASTGSTARFDLTCVTSRRHAWLPHRTLRFIRNSFVINNLRAQRNFRYPFHSQFRIGLNHTLQDYLRRLPTVDGPGHDTDRCRLGAVARPPIASSPRFRRAGRVCHFQPLRGAPGPRGAGSRRQRDGGRLELFGRRRSARLRRPSSKSSGRSAIVPDDRHLQATIVSRR